MKKESNGDRRRILVMSHGPEDDGLVHALREARYDVSRARSDFDAPAQVTEAAPDLVVIDVSSHASTGINTARHLRASSEVPFLFFSVHDDLATATSAIDAGACAYCMRQQSAAPYLQLMSAVAASIAQAEQFRRLREAVQDSRDTCTAVGVLMERHGFDRRTAYQRLRDYARTSRRRLNEIALELVLAVEKINSLDSFAPSSRRAAVEAGPV